MNIARPLALLLTSFIPMAQAKSPSESVHLRPTFAAGQMYSNVFSILHSIKADGYDELTRRNGGSADYTAVAAGPDVWRFELAYRYDGSPAAKASIELRENGTVQCVLKAEGKQECQPYHDGSGLAFNLGMWGTPPPHLAAGMSWTVALKDAWELGGANGTEKVTVVSTDPATDTVVLMREGSATGFNDGEPQQTKLTHNGQEETLEKVPGLAHWKGYGVFVKGIVFADSLLVTRDLALKDQNGKSIPAAERWIMLLNSAPYPSL